jgi:DNA polymerase III epsilon subunit-like protein
VTEPAGLELRDRAFRFVSERGSASDEEVLKYVYGGSAPAALHATLARPLLSDPRLERRVDGTWSVRSTQVAGGFTALALVATGPSPQRAHVVGVVALHLDSGEVVQRFSVIVDPGVRVPRYALDRLRVEIETLENEPSFGDVVDQFEAFLGSRPVLAQDAALTWEFLEAEARRLGRVLVEPRLIDFNDLAAERLQLKGKPSLSVVAGQLGVASVRVTHVEEEARLLGLIGARLMATGVPDGVRTTAAALRKGSTARALPDQPGVYVLRDGEQSALYVGKARRLRSRMEAYVHRPLGATRRLEGLVGNVQAVDTTECQTDLEALILEDREIRRLQPRFNTVRQQSAPRLWIRRPYEHAPRRGRPLAPPRLELSVGPGTTEGEFVGPFRNEAVANAARKLAREVFDLDGLRRGQPAEYAFRLAEAWEFLGGESRTAEALARGKSVALLRKVLAFDVRALLLPADPLQARYAVVRPAPEGIEGFVVDRAVLVAWASLADDDDGYTFARRLLEPAEPHTAPEDAPVVLRWFGAQRPTARLVHLPDDDLAAADAIEAAALELMSREAGAPGREDAFDPLGDV